MYGMYVDSRIGNLAFAISAILFLLTFQSQYLYRILYLIVLQYIKTKPKKTT